MAHNRISLKETGLLAIIRLDADTFRIVHKDAVNKKTGLRTTNLMVEKIQSIFAERAEEVKRLLDSHLPEQTKTSKLSKLNEIYNAQIDRLCSMLNDAVKEKYPLDDVAWYKLLPQLVQCKSYTMINYILNNIRVKEEALEFVKTAISSAIMIDDLSQVEVLLKKLPFEKEQVSIRQWSKSAINNNKKELFSKLLPYLKIESACAIDDDGNLMHIAAGHYESIYLMKLLAQFPQTKDQFDVLDSRGYTPKDYAFARGLSLNLNVLKRQGYKYGKSKDPRILALVLYKNAKTHHNGQINITHCYDLYIKENYSKEMLLEIFGEKDNYNHQDMVNLLLKTEIHPKIYIWVLWSCIAAHSIQTDVAIQTQYELLISQLLNKIGTESMPAKCLENDVDVETSILETYPQLFKSILKAYINKTELAEWKIKLLHNALFTENNDGEDIFARIIMLHDVELFHLFIDFYQHATEEFTQALPMGFESEDSFKQNYFHYIAALNIYNSSGHVDKQVANSVREMFDKLYSLVPEQLTEGDDENISPILVSLFNENMVFFNKCVEAGCVLMNTPVPSNYGSLYDYLIENVDPTTIFILIEDQSISLNDLFSKASEETQTRYFGMIIDQLLIDDDTNNQLFKGLLQRIHTGTILHALAKRSWLHPHLIDLLYTENTYSSDLLEQPDDEGKTFLHYLCSDVANVKSLKMLLQDNRFDSIFHCGDREGVTPLSLILKNKEMTNLLKGSLKRFNLTESNQKEALGTQPSESEKSEPNLGSLTPEIDEVSADKPDTPEVPLKSKHEICHAQSPTLFSTPKTPRKHRKKQTEKKSAGPEEQKFGLFDSESPKPRRAVIYDYFSKKKIDAWNQQISDAKEDESGMIHIPCNDWGIQTTGLISDDLQSIIHHLKNLFYKLHPEKSFKVMLVGSKVAEHMYLNKLITANDEDFIVLGLTASDIQDFFESHPEYGITTRFITAFRSQTAVLKLILKNGAAFDFKPVDELKNQFYERDFTLNGIALDIFNEELIAPKAWFKNLVRAEIVSIPQPNKFKFNLIEKIRCMKMLVKYTKLEPKIDEKSTKIPLTIPEFDSERQSFNKLIEKIDGKKIEQHDDAEALLQEAICEGSKYRYHRSDLGKTLQALDTLTFQLSKVFDHCGFEMGLQKLIEYNLPKQFQIDSNELVSHYQIIQRFLTDYLYSLSKQPQTPENQQKQVLIYKELERYDIDIQNINANAKIIEHGLRKLVGHKPKATSEAFTKFSNEISREIVLSNYQLEKVSSDQLISLISQLLHLLPTLEVTEDKNSYRNIKKFTYGLLAATLMQGYDVKLYLQNNNNHETHRKPSIPQ